MSLDIFERGVQDPFSEACDNEDVKDLLSVSTEDINPNVVTANTSPISSSDFHGEYRPVEEIQYPQKSSSFYMDNNNNNINNKNRNTRNGIGSSLRKIRTAPHKLGSLSPLMTQEPFHNLQKATWEEEQERQNEESTSPLCFPLRRNRANSSSFIHHLSRQSTNTNSNNNSGIFESPQFLNKQTNNNTINFSNTTTPTRCNSVTSKPLSRHSSCFAIPTHIYGLEKYVLSELDALSTVGCNNSNNNSGNNDNNNNNNNDCNSCLCGRDYDVPPTNYKYTGTKLHDNGNSKNPEMLSFMEGFTFNNPSPTSSSGSSINLPELSQSNANSINTSPRTNFIRPSLHNRRKSSIRLSLENSFQS
ncbi:Isf1p NDAI_0H02130 [Naumovozyma dairenensis CBS 421]|uniref:Uncharacterized protein n=1 Tax=Naumovozyma dairenensis (strain ATCC 10597 / BCRC 20456 / CBS 421 / NBRC 0211 / NRRL Y-12639) TaxID=1071378 RepID=G0WF26_NAUDC|nr:hypothetical protein NDAI_0H02130 [Naumovozyma dairenensis CBS 421]CCD26387.1 hypothetical protein NDAI_0H02130 [Naumovozyma dairenensis CBS 421]